MFDLEVPKTKAKELTDQEKVFLEVLFREAKGDLFRARDIAGYPKSMPVTVLAKRFKAEILESAQLYVAMHSPAAISALIDIVTSYDPIPDARNKIAAAKEILGMAGLARVERKEVTHMGGVALLPPKDDAR